jgi:hypothetical protein
MTGNNGHTVSVFSVTRSLLLFFAYLCAAETGVSIADPGYVANVYGRASIPAVKIAGPLVIRPADVNVAGREPVQGTTSMAVTTRKGEVSEVFRRT